MARIKAARTIRISNPDWHQLEIDAKRLGYPSRHAYIIDRLKIVPQIEKTPDAA